MPAKINIVTAWLAEAKPIITQQKLKRNHQLAKFEVYSTDDQSINLVISSSGTLKSSIATSYLHAMTATNQTVYLNIGIAGSNNYSIGELLLANKISHTAYQPNFYPTTHLLKTAGKRDNLLTVDQASDDYSASLIDMEAYGFITAANSFVSLEQIHCLKIVSDHDSQSQASVSPKLATGLIQAQLENIVTLIDELISLSDLLTTHQQTVDVAIFTQRWHFTNTQQHQLAELLRRWQINLPRQSAVGSVDDCPSAKAVIYRLTEQLDQTDYRWES